MRIRFAENKAGHVTVYVDDVAMITLTEHDLRDLEFALAQRRAMSRRCEATRGEHTCALYLGHVEAHLCRACTEAWSGNTL